jgi:hypothetical protein
MTHWNRVFRSECIGTDRSVPALLLGLCVSPPEHESDHGAWPALTHVRQGDQVPSDLGHLILIVILLGQDHIDSLRLRIADSMYSTHDQCASCICTLHKIIDLALSYLSGRSYRIDLIMVLTWDYHSLSKIDYAKGRRISHLQ